MKENFICKLCTENFKIGSFDAYYNISRELIQKNSGYSLEEAEELLKKFPTSYRATILDKDDNYIGYISTYDNDAIMSTYSLRLETNKILSEEEREEITSTYKKWCYESLNFEHLEDEVCISKEKIVKQNERYIRPSIVVPKKYLRPGIDSETLNYMKEFYNIPNLQFPFTIVDDGRVIGIIGVSNLVPSTRRAALRIYFNKDIESVLSYEIGKTVIDDYVKYLHDLKINSVATEVSLLDEKKIEMFDETSMSRWGAIPFASNFDGMVGPKIMYQNVPGYSEKDTLYVPNDLVVSNDVLLPKKEEFSEILMVDENYRLISPKSFAKYNIDVYKLARQYGKCLEDRENLTKTLGADKFIPQIGNEKYGLVKTISNSTYVLVNRDNNFAGFVNRLRDDKENGNIEVEAALDPNIHSRGIGTKMAMAFNDEMFKMGYTGITGGVFSFNDKSLNLNRRLGSFNGVRIESYYINGKYFDMDYFTTVNPEVSGRARHLKQYN